MRLDDFLMLGTTVPQATSKYEAAVCSAGYSHELEMLVRVYPLGMKHAPCRWSTNRIDLERPPKNEDSRKESFKIQGTRTSQDIWKINQRFETVEKPPKLKGAAFRDVLRKQVVSSIDEANSRRQSLAIVFPDNVGLKLERNDLSPEDAQLRLFQTDDMYSAKFGHKKFPQIPRITFTDTAGSHSLKLLDWGTFELMRKEASLITSEYLAKALHLGPDSALLVGNLANQRNAWIVISVLNDIRTATLFDSQQASADLQRARARRQRELVVAVWGTNCYACGLTVDMQTDPALPHGPTVEHVTPIAHGGSNDIANLRISHRRCNIAKGTKAS